MGIKSSAGSYPSSLVHFKHSHDCVIRGYTHIELVARICTGNPFRCAVTDHSYSALWAAFRATEPHISSPIFSGGPSILLHHTTDACLQGGRKVKAQQLPLAHYRGRRAQSKSKTASTRALKNDTFELNIFHWKFSEEIRIAVFYRSFSKI